MSYINQLSNVSVLGAAGKMGSGILLLTAMEMANQKLKNGGEFKLNAIDISEEGLQGLLKYVEKQVSKTVGKKPEKFAGFFEAGMADEEIVNAYTKAVMDIIHTSTDMKVAYESTLIFEAIIENFDLKVKIFSEIDSNNPHKPYFFSNTSSIPIHVLDEAAKLGGRILGFHFYNPPAIQRLVELITTNKNSEEMKEFALTYAKNLRKVVVPSNDKAGFIGNGHFMRDALHGIKTTERLSKEMSFVEALFAVNKVSHYYLVRPMGIFQLIDYVGIDVVKFIMQVMNPHLPDEDLHSDLLDKMMEMGVKGGQNSDGSQKDGFLKYEGGKFVAVFDPEKKEYVSINEFKDSCKEKLGDLPESWKAWKEINFSPDKEKLLETYFADLWAMDNFGVELAREYHAKSKAIGELLVDTEVALKAEDVNTVMLTGFFHAFGPINNYL